MQRRPGFPARLDGAGGAASKPAPAPLRPTVRPNVPAAPHGVGLDSAAVRARMVQRLAAAGIPAVTTSDMESWLRSWLSVPVWSSTRRAFSQKRRRTGRIG